VDVPKHYNAQEIVQKPSCVHDYNKLIGAVDRTDMVISTINSTRKTTKWYKKYFFHMIDMCLWKSYCLYKLKTGKTISITKFQLKLIDQILKKYQEKASRHPIDPKIITYQDSTEDIFLLFMKPKEKVDRKGVLYVRKK